MYRIVHIGVINALTSILVFLIWIRLQESCIASSFAKCELIKTKSNCPLDQSEFETDKTLQRKI